MRLYIAGAVSSDPDYVNHFMAGKATVEAAGHTAVLPPNLQPAGYDHSAFMAEHNGTTPADSLREYLKGDLVALLDCEGIALLPTWCNSRGAKVELNVALGTGMSVWSITFDYNAVVENRGTVDCA